MRGCKHRYFFISFLIYVLIFSMCHYTEAYADTVFCHGASELSNDMKLYMRASQTECGRTSQGMCAAGRYLIYTRFQSDYAYTTYVVIDSLSGQIVGKYDFRTLHSNSLTYNPDRQEVVCVTMNHAYVFSFRNHRLDLVQDIIMNHNCCKIAYIPSLKTYFLGTGNTIYRSDDFRHLKKVFSVSEMAVNQGMGFDGNYLYICWYRPGHNVLAVYSPDGKYQKTYTIISPGLREIEEVDFVDEKMIINVANSGTRDGLYTVACVHQFGSWEVTKAAGCSKDGMESRTCRLCGKTELKTIPATGIHHLTPWKTVTAPTCEDAGLETRVCSECGSAIKKRKLPAKGHVYTYWKRMEKSTVLLHGYEMRYCDVCEKVQERDIPCLPATISLSTDELPVHQNQSAEGIRVFLNEGDRIVSWRSANPKIASVTETGQITGHRLGETRITVKTAGHAEKSIKVRVTLFPIFTTGLSVRTAGLNHSALSLKQGDKQKLEISKYPVTSFNPVTFSVDDSKIARIAPDGTVFALKKGKTRICIHSWLVRKNIELNVQ